MTTAMDDVMAEPERKTMPVRLGLDAIEAGKIAASLKGMSLAEYATAVLRETANREIDDWTKARQQGRASGRKGGSK
jgi:hypothetical protein